MNVLLIDDDRELCSLLKEYLAGEGISLSIAGDGVAGLRQAVGGEADLIVLDLMLPKLDGLTVLRRLREKRLIPVLILTGKGREEDRIAGLEEGADDYLAKPFSPRELLARLRAIWRRTRTSLGPSEDSKIEIGDVVLDAATREVFSNRVPVTLTTVEFNILDILMRAAGRTVSRDQLTELVYQRRLGPYDRSIDMHVSHLRKKLDTESELIKTIHGIGYQFSLARRRSR